MDGERSVCGRKHSVRLTKGGERIGMGAAAVQGQIPELWAGWVGVGLHAVNGCFTDADAVPPYS